MAYDEPATKANLPVFGFEVWDLGRTAFKVEFSMEVRWAHAGDLRMTDHAAIVPFVKLSAGVLLKHFLLGDHTHGFNNQHHSLRPMVDLHTVLCLSVRAYMNLHTHNTCH